MNYWHCKCGKTEYVESGMPPTSCKTCDECGSTLISGSMEYRDPAPHEPKKQYNQNTGKPYYICKRCFERIEIDDKEQKKEE